MIVQGKRILATPKTNTEKTDSGIHIPDSAKKDNIAFVAQMVGDEVTFVSRGETFYVSPAIGGKQVNQPIKFKEQEYILFSEDQIVAKDE